MGGISITQTGDFNKVQKGLNSLLDRDYLNVISHYGQMGVQALRAATPVDTGLAASGGRAGTEPQIVAINAHANHPPANY